MSLSKKSASAIIILILIVGLAMFIIVPSDSPDDPDNPFETEPNNSSPDNSDDPNISEIEIDGLNVESDGTITTNPQIITNNHKSSLLNKSLNVTYDSPETEARILKFGNRILITEDVSFAVVNTYSNGVLTYKNENFDGESTYSAERGTVSGSKYHQSNFFRAIMNDLQVIEAEKQQDGYKIKMTGDEGLNNIESVLPEVDQVNSADVDIYISSNGLIREMKMDLVGQDLLGVPQNQDYNYTVNKIGNVEVERPSWVSVASSRTSILQVTSDQENNWIEIEHNGLATVEKDSVIRIVTSSGRSSVVELENAFSQNDTMYLIPESTDEWRTSINSIPDRPGGVNFSDGDEVLVEIIKPDGDSIEFTYYTDTVQLGGNSSS